MVTESKFTAGQAASILGLDRSTVIRLAQKGLLPSEVVAGPKRTALRLFSRADVEALREKRITEAVEALEAMPGVAKVTVTRSRAAAA